MVVVIFGMFNIITAIFVEATMNGLKETDAARWLGCDKFLCKINTKAPQAFHIQMWRCLAPRKYAQAYESTYMTEQLGKLVMNISKHVSSMRKAEGAVTKHLVSKCRIFQCIVCRHFFVGVLWCYLPVIRPDTGIQ